MGEKVDVAGSKSSQELVGVANPCGDPPLASTRPSWRAVSCGDHKQAGSK